MLYLVSGVGADLEEIRVEGASQTSLDLNIEQGHRLPSWVHTARHYVGWPKPWQFTKCLATLHKYRFNHSTAALRRRTASCNLISGPLAGNVARSTWFLNHTNYASRVNVSNCAHAFSLVWPRLAARAPSARAPPPDGFRAGWGVLQRIL